MNDDFPDFVVRSGSEHHVSVSERTGNAKTPKNIVVSHPEETRERKLAFDHIHDISSSNPAQDKDLLPPASAETIPASDNDKTNVLKVPITVLAPNKQDVNIDSVQDRRQAIEPDNALGTNRQATTTTAPTSANVQNVDTEVIADNKQTLPTQAVKDNLQSISNSPPDSENRLTMPGSAPVAPNVQSVAGDAIVPDNLQSLAQDTLDDNHAKVDAARAVANRQAIAQDDAGANRQAVNHTASTTNRQPGLANAVDVNEQNIPTLHVEPHRHRVDEAEGAPDNRQAIDSENITDHLEKLPGSEFARAAINAPLEANTPNAPGTDNTSADVSVPGVLSAEEKKLKHEEAAAAFQRRLLGIKHNVDNLNDRLTDFEQKLS